MLLADILEESARKGSDRVAVRFKGKAYTYEDVRQRVGRLTAAWVRLGVRPGDHVAVIAPNSLAFIETTFSCARLGAVCEAYNVRLAPRVIVELLKRSNAQVVVVTPEMQERLAGLWKDVGCPLTLVLLDDAAEGAEGVVGAAGEGASGAPAEGAAPGGAAGEGASDVAFEGALVQGVQAQHGYEGLLASAADEPLPEAVAVRPEDPVFMLYTSGTTGLPKGVVFSQEAMVNRAQADVEGMRFSRDDIMLFVLPFYHVTCVSVFAVLLVGAQMVIGQSNKAPDIVSYVNRYGVTRVGLVPYHMRTLAAYVEAEHVTVDTLKLRHLRGGAGRPRLAVPLPRPVGMRLPARLRHDGNGLVGDRAPTRAPQGPPPAGNGGRALAGRGDTHRRRGRPRLPAWHERGSGREDEHAHAGLLERPRPDGPRGEGRLVLHRRHRVRGRGRVPYLGRPQEQPGHNRGRERLSAGSEQVRPRRWAPASPTWR